MKFFKYFSYSELKLICKQLEKESCYYRAPKRRFTECFDKEANKCPLIENLVDGGCLKDSPSTGQHWDYNEDCYEFTKKFKRVYNFMTCPFWLWIKIYVLNFYWFKHKWQHIRIACGHHYDWQDYQGYGAETF